MYRETTYGIRQRFSRSHEKCSNEGYDNGNEITAMRKYKYNKGNKVALLDVSRTKKQGKTNVL